MNRFEQQLYGAFAAMDRRNNLQPETTMTTATRTVALTDAARIKAALNDAGVRVAIQIDGDDAQLIYLACDAQAAADAIAAELSR